MPVIQRQFSQSTLPQNSWRAYFRRLSTLKRLFWAYFLLLIFEGALRKWILPQLSAPLLLVRDPVGLLIIFEAFRTNKWPGKWTAVTGVLAAALGTLAVMQVVVAGNLWYAAIYGLRSYLLPFPVAFVFGENLDAEDLRRFGLCALWLLLPLTLLEIAQFRAPSGSFLNVGAGTGARQISYVGLGVRASGTFSFVTGPTSYGPLAAAFLFYGLVNEKFAKKWLLWAAVSALILSVPVVGSRAMVFLLAAVVACAGISALLGVTQFLKTLKLAVPVVAIYFVVSLLPVFHRSSADLAERFRTANESGENLAQSTQKRTIGQILRRLEETDLSKDLLGVGMGSGAAAVAKLETGRVQFLVAEDEFSRVMLEFGPFFGLPYSLFCLFLGLKVGFEAIQRARDHDPLALLLFPMFFTSMGGVMEQPTSQGFMVIGLAFSLAALKSANPAVRPVRAARPVPRPLRYSNARRLG